jgi:ornithine cyclodeaminase/alanine dehydrogenase-like protein (mu-crystallin family)
LQHRFGLETAIGPNPAKLRDAAILCTATNAREPLFEAVAVRADVHINAIGAYRPDMCELPAALLREATVYVDSIASAAREAGDLLQAFGPPDAVTRHIRAIGELLVKPHSERPSGRTVYKAVGNAGQDLYAAAETLRLLDA